jgi:hypothetical protein
VSATDDFARFRARREAERAAAWTLVWRRVSPVTGGGWTARAADFRRVYVVRVEGGYEYGLVVDGARERRGSAGSLPAAKLSAASLLEPREAGDERREDGGDGPA